MRLSYGLPLVLVALLCGTVEATAATKFLVYGCTSDRMAARIQVFAALKDKPAIERAFRSVVRSKTSKAFLALKQPQNDRDGLKALSDLRRLSGGKLPPQDPATLASSIAVNKRANAIRQYCGG